jgi:hypothetical protein
MSLKVRNNKKEKDFYLRPCYCIVNSQIQEMNMFQQNLMELERTQQMIKKQ